MQRRNTTHWNYRFRNVMFDQAYPYGSLSCMIGSDLVQHTLKPDTNLIMTSYPAAAADVPEIQVQLIRILVAP